MRTRHHFALPASPYAVETVPGLPDLIKFEEAIRCGDDPTLNLRKFMLGENEFVEWGPPPPQQVTDKEAEASAPL